MSVLCHSYLGPNGAFVNGQKEFDIDFSDRQYLKVIYENLVIDYPKFHKMDVLSKLLILTEELLHEEIPNDVNLEDDMALLMANRSSSAVVDQKFIDSYTLQNNPSPSLFVYTLPNIAIGELSIRRKWYGENSFFIAEQFDANFFIRQCEGAFRNGNTHALCAWIEADMRGNEECFLFLVTHSEEENLEQALIDILNTYRNE
jgi:hypothetical protein